MAIIKQLSPRLQNYFLSARDLGAERKNQEIFPEHIIYLLLKAQNSLGFVALYDLNVKVSLLLEKLDDFFYEKSSGISSKNIMPSRRMQTIISNSALESNTLGNSYIGTEHFVISCFRENNSLFSSFLVEQNITLEELRIAVKNAQFHFDSSGKNYFHSADGGVQGINVNQPVKVFSVTGNASEKQEKSKNRNSFLKQYGRDLTALARENALEKVVGRKTETERLIQILCRRTKNNPVLTGEAGVGKTAVIEGLAQRIACGDVPFQMIKKKLVSLDLASLVAGTKYRGEFEERMTLLLKEAREDKDLIIFIDELHTLIGAGGPEGSMDASNILKPALSRAEIQIIGSTTSREYRKYLEKDPALERRFQTVKINEPSKDETIEILNGIKKSYEQFHGVTYEQDVIPAIVNLTSRYMTDRNFPDKAIDILDETGSAKKLSEDYRPKELDELEQSIEQLTLEKTELVLNQNYEKAAVVRDKVIELKRKLEDFSNSWKLGSISIQKTVTVEDVCRTISKITGIPLEQLDSDESKKLLSMEKQLHKKVAGQDEAVNVLSRAIRRSRAGISSGDRPLGSFIFLGPTGVGKTQLAKTLAEFLFGSKDALIRIDMSDYMEKHNASRLVGSPPGYVGFDEGGVLTEKVRHKPYSVILLDEIEKAHPDIFNLLLQLLEEGELCDNLGHTVNFRNTVIIMTSNAGAREITRENKLGFSSSSDALPYSEIKANAINELKKFFRPELLNRIDDVIVFQSLSRKEISKILDLMLSELEKRLSEKSLALKISPKAKEYLLDNGYDSQMGARPMRRLIQNEIEEKIAVLILEGKTEGAEGIKIDLKNGSICVSAVMQKNKAKLFAQKI